MPPRSSAGSATGRRGSSARRSSGRDRGPAPATTAAPARSTVPGSGASARPRSSGPRSWGTRCPAPGRSARPLSPGRAARPARGRRSAHPDPGSGGRTPRAMSRCSRTSASRTDGPRYGAYCGRSRSSARSAPGPAIHPGRVCPFRTSGNLRHRISSCRRPQSTSRRRHRDTRGRHGARGRRPRGAGLARRAGGRQSLHLNARLACYCQETTLKPLELEHRQDARAVRSWRCRARSTSPPRPRCARSSTDHRRWGPRLVVDLSGLGFIDSSGLGVLVAALKHMRERDGQLVLAGLSSPHSGCSRSPTSRPSSPSSRPSASGP